MTPDRVGLVRERARFIRRETIRLVGIAKSGHYGSTLSSAEILACLYYAVMRYDPARPQWPDRDRFVLSKGHAANGLYPVLADVGFFPVAWLDTYTRLGSRLGDHPDMTKIPGIDFSSGSLGHGISAALGMALGGRMDGKGYRVYCLLGDGELNEGQVWEAAAAASHYRLGNLVAVVDRNGVSVDGNTEEILNMEPIAAKFAAFGWDVVEVDGHDVPALLSAFDGLPSPATAERPTMIIAHTVPGKGVSFMEGSHEWHLGYLAPTDAERALAELAGEGEPE